MIELVLPVPPSANRWWRNVKGRMVLSREARAYKKNLPALAGRQEIIRRPNRVRVTITWYRDMRSGDLDKRQGVMLDALQGVCYENDSQIKELHAYQEEDPGNGRMVVHIEAIPVEHQLELRSAVG